MAPPKKKHRFWRICRIYFRRFRITIWVLLLLLFGILVYLNQVGLPGFIKRPLIEKLRARGLDLQFSRLRLRWFQGIVADNVRFGQANEPDSPQLLLSELQIRINPLALRKMQLQVDSVMLRRGRLVLPISATNAMPRQISLDNIQTELRFLPGDQWSLDHFTARFAGVNIQLSGLVTNASSVRDWKIFQAERGPPGARTPSNRLRRFSELLENIRFSAAPDLRIDIRGDARDIQSFNVLILVAAPGALTPWGAVSHGRVISRLFPADTNGVSRAEMRLEADDAQTKWGTITNFQLSLHLASDEAQTNLVHGELTLSTHQVQTDWAAATNAHFSAHWLHSITNPIPISGHGEFKCEAARTPWAMAGSADFAADLATPAPSPPELPAACAWWTNLQPFALTWSSALTNLQAHQVQAEYLISSGTWLSPRLNITNLNASLYGGNVDVKLGVDVLSRELEAAVASNVDPQKIATVLPAAAGRWLGQFTWDQAPKVHGSIGVVLPSWTNREPNWQSEVQPTLRLEGEFDAPDGGSYRQVPVSSAKSHFTYANLCWHLPDLTLIRPEGKVLAEHRADERAKTFSWRLQSTVDPTVLKPVLEKEAQRVLDLFAFTQPPVISAEISGRFRDSEDLSLRATVALTNFTFRGESVSGVQASLAFSNKVLTVFEPRLQRGTRVASASGLEAHFDREVMYLTNGFSTIEPMVVANAIGKHVARILEPYQFSQPPIAHVNGVIPLRDETDADLHFQISGGPFHWWKFDLPYVMADLHWSGDYLTLTNVQADFFDGKAAGSAHFHFLPKEDAEFQFSMAATNVLLQRLISALATHTNHLEGRLSGDLMVTRATTGDWHKVNGYGGVSLRDGLIWDIPLFGIFSPVLNGISPGLGNSRATAANSIFSITNGVIHTDNLELRSPAMRLLYRGEVDLDGRVNARVEAELLRDMWVVGPIVSTIFWPVTKLFEYRVSGSLGEPRSEPVFIIPKLVLMPFHPFKTLKGLLPDENK